MDILEPCDHVKFFPKLDIPQKVKEWKYDTDSDDIFYISSEDVNGNLVTQVDYRTISHILLTLYGNTGISENEVLSEYLEEATNSDIEHKEAIMSQVRNIIYLYGELGKFPLSTQIRNLEQDKCIILYRGFRNNTAKSMFNRLHSENRLGLGSCITIPMFMSTSMIEETSLRFTGENYIMWKIIVPVKKREIFRYTNISNVDYDITGDFDLQNSEAEILLNIGTILKCIGIKENIERSYRNPNADGSYSLRTIKFTLFVYEFVGYEKVPIEEYLKNLH